MSLFDHASVGVPDIAAAREFYDPLMKTLGASCLAVTDELAAYGREVPQFVIILPFDKQAATAGNGTHLCFAAPSRAAVDEFSRTALAGGGRDEGAPGPRPDYPKPGVYAAFVRDPFGNKLEAIHGGFTA
jgi:catechol 2,3-dioxygenase-like lactoylglutathione lyase family enzyme